MKRSEEVINKDQEERYFYAHLVGRRASFAAMTLLKLICFSAGGPFLGCPRMITESPERTFES